MATIDPEQLFQQAERLITQHGSGAPRKVDLRRAISNAYYGVFHFLAKEAADFFVGRTKSQSEIYHLVYRSVDHHWLRQLCEQAKKPTLSKRYASYIPSNGFGRNIQAFAAAVEQLQEKRHSADYDPSFDVKKSDALRAVGAARSAAERFRRANSNRRNAFLALLLFRPR